MRLCSLLSLVPLVFAACTFRGSSAGDGDGDGDGDGGGELAVPAERTCGGVSTYVETFDSGAPQGVWNLLNAPGVMFDGSEVRINPQGSSATGLQSLDFLELVEDTAVIEVSKHWDEEDTNSVASFVAVREATTLFAGFHMTHNELTVEVQDNGTAANQVFPLDRNAHRFLRLAETQSTLHFDVSPNGTDWTRLVSTPSPGFLIASRLQFVAQGAETTEIRTEGINTDRPLVASCAMSSVSDDFGDGERSYRWSVYQNNRCAPVIESSGSLILDQTAGTTETTAATRRSRGETWSMTQ